MRWVRLRADAQAARAEGVPLRRWAGWALRCEANETLMLDDPLPNLVANVLRPAARRARAAAGRARD